MIYIVARNKAGTEVDAMYRVEPDRSAAVLSEDGTWTESLDVLVAWQFQELEGEEVPAASVEALVRQYVQSSRQVAS